MIKRIFAPVFKRLAKSLGIPGVQQRLDALEQASFLHSISDETYEALEQRFRGSSELITERQKQYLPIVKEVHRNDAPLLDLGFGRAEWMKLLKEHGISSHGVDSNDVFVRNALKDGLDVTKEDLLTFLSQQPQNSFSAVTMLQVAEHLPLRVLESVLSQIHRVLIPSGVVIIEIPNIETLRVGAGTFWIDPTHVRPLFPEFLSFLTERAGFSSIQAKASSPLDDSLAIEEIDVQTKMIQQMWQRINGPGDFAIIAKK
ncbi:unannotated protein [freshwater metagenome]|uniref:Unannotated protein n=1 Tax=freshwater metagenome TaxID=449393 RepID=A0A6J6E9E3_9ZZZZ|nr:methyltransferase domain-containing protein [Actinomycetota bacterium]